MALKTAPLPALRDLLPSSSLRSRQSRRQNRGKEVEYPTTPLLLAKAGPSTQDLRDLISVLADRVSRLELAIEAPPSQTALISAQAPIGPLSNRTLRTLKTKTPPIR